MYSAVYFKNMVITGNASSSGPADPTAITFTTPASCLTDRFNISWTGPNAYNSANNTLLAFLKQGSAITVGTASSAPSTYTTASTTFGSGNPYQNDASAYCIYNGDGTNAAGDHSGELEPTDQVEHFSLRIASASTTLPPVRRRKMKRMLPLVAWV